MSEQEIQPIKWDRRLIMQNLIATAIFFVFSLILVVKASRTFGEEILIENGPVEIVTFMFMFGSGIIGLTLAFRYWSAVPRYLTLGLGFIGLVFVVAAMEEIAWGQHFFGYEPPDSIKAINAQDEFTLHNHNNMQNHTEVLPLTFALAGLVGIALRRFGVLPLLMPSMRLIGWFVPVFVVAGLDLMHDYYVPYLKLDILVNHLDEVNEMVAAITVFAYLMYRVKEMQALAPAPASAGEGGRAIASDD